jgi:hypothetical protein
MHLSHCLGAKIKILISVGVRKNQALGGWKGDSEYSEQSEKL